MLVIYFYMYYNLKNISHNKLVLCKITSKTDLGNNLKAFSSIKDDCVWFTFSNSSLLKTPENLIFTKNNVLHIALISNNVSELDFYYKSKINFDILYNSLKSQRL